MNNNDINQSYTQAFFTIIFKKRENFFYLPVFTKYFNVNYRKEKATGINQSPKNILILTTIIERSIERSFTMNNNDINQSYTQAFFTKKDRDDTK